MAKTPKYIKAAAVKQILEVVELMRPLLAQSISQKVTDDISTRLDDLFAITMTDISDQKSLTPAINIGETISKIIVDFALECQPDIAWNILKEISQYSPVVETSIRPNGLKLKQNQLLIAQSLRCSTLIGMAYIATQIEYELRSHAIQARADISELIAFEMLDLQNVEMIAILIEYKNLSTRHLSNLIKTLSTVISAETEKPTPSLVLAHNV